MRQITEFGYGSNFLQCCFRCGKQAYEKEMVDCIDKKDHVVFYCKKCFEKELNE